VRLSVVIVTRARPQSLHDTLASLARCDPPPDEVVVVDGDEQRTAKAVAAEHDAGAGARVRYLDGVFGLSRQRNAGLDSAAGDLVLFCDDDVDVSPGALGHVLRAFERDPGVVGVTGQVIDPAARRLGSAQSTLRRRLPAPRRQGTMAACGFPRRLVTLDRPRDVEFLHGCFMAARRDLAAEVRFDERLTGYALGEDEDFGYRLSRRGRVRYVPDALVIHKSTGFRSMDQREFNRRLVINRAYLFRKNLSPTLRSRIWFAAMVAVLALHRAVNREWRGVLGLVEGSLLALRGTAPGDGPPRPSVSYSCWDQAWGTYTDTVVALADATSVAAVCDIGGGANPTIDPATANAMGIAYTLLDLSADELAKAPAGMRKVHGDIVDPPVLAGERFDLICSRTVAEHIADPAAFHARVRELLAPGGRAVHFFSTLWSLPFVANLVLPERLTDALLRRVQAHRGSEGLSGKFPVHYRWCRGPTPRQLRRFEDLGYVVEHYTGFFGHDYYKPLPVLQRIEALKARALVRRPRPSLTSYALVVLRRSV
jgi:GT2 family glycosyltransferase